MEQPLWFPAWSLVSSMGGDQLHVTGPPRRRDASLHAQPAGCARRSRGHPGEPPKLQARGRGSQVVISSQRGKDGVEEMQ